MNRAARGVVGTDFGGVGSARVTGEQTGSRIQCLLVPGDHLAETFSVHEPLRLQLAKDLAPRLPRPLFAEISSSVSGRPAGVVPLGRLRSSGRGKARRRLSDYRATACRTRPWRPPWRASWASSGQARRRPRRWPRRPRPSGGGSGVVLPCTFLDKDLHQPCQIGRERKAWDLSTFLAREGSAARHLGVNCLTLSVIAGRGQQGSASL